MSAQITVHLPHGIVPKIAVNKKTVVDYQPSWLLLAVPAMVLWRAMRRTAPTPGATPRDLSTDRPDLAASSGGRRWSPTRVVVVPLGRLRRRPAAVSGPAEDPVSTTSFPQAEDSTL